MVDRQVCLYLEEPLRISAQRGEHNFINLLQKVLTSAGLEPIIASSTTHSSPPRQLSLSHMAHPPNDMGLVFRRVYHYPFWQIDKVAQRWHWDIAKAHFDPDVAPSDANRFFRFWRKRIFGDAVLGSIRDGFVYVPLQGKLDQRRPFQSCTPLEMVAHCLEYEPKRRVVATLHPKEAYSAIEVSKLEELARRHSRLSIDTGQMAHYLLGCDYVVTQNSSAAFFGNFFQKPALLFGQIDFHHITVLAEIAALQDSFARVADLQPDYAKYVWWFWQDQSINAGRENAEAKIALRLRRFGWPLDSVD